ncbi:MAG: hypothetical protein AB1512_12635 [Thermodesulfobacteriota bacterium]
MMAKVKIDKKPAIPRTTAQSKKKAITKGVLDRLTSDEIATVLRTLLKRHTDLRREAEAVALELVSSPLVEDIAEDVFDRVTGLGADAIQGKAGKQSWGYVEPDQAALELLEEAVDDVVADMKRRMELGLDAAAEAICCGIVLAMHRAEGVKSDDLLAWVPDFPAEEACHVVAELIRACPAAKRGAVSKRLDEAFGDLGPEWAEMLSHAAKRVAQGK